MSATDYSFSKDFGSGQHIHEEYNMVDECTIPVPDDILPPIQDIVS